MNFEYKCSSCGGIFELQKVFGKSAPKTSICKYDGGCGGIGVRHYGSFQAGPKSSGYDTPDLAGKGASFQTGTLISDAFNANTGEYVGEVAQPVISINIPNPKNAQRRNQRIRDSSSRN